ncbi:hypothetical protein IscW_ISCW013269 [Ixodes scapularis]|uniref:Uncharacterized protein n=1 Tax=Ixodes scapularis TaxID=6945 RepID=B7QG85_IXOSC|nr:hypothetical protein IscW_ISCW013269 [Ixodes scapularis]|eukprot:XP_002401304.1 hypothetical protein IscW_ISCW013269 [Ixodes scapularis]
MALLGAAASFDLICDLGAWIRTALSLSLLPEAPIRRPLRLPLQNPMRRLLVSEPLSDALFWIITLRCPALLTLGDRAADPASKASLALKDEGFSPGFQRPAQPLAPNR